MTMTTLYKWIGERSDMTWCDPDIGIHHDWGIEEDHIFSFLDEFSDPEIFDIFLQEYPEWTVVPGVRKTTVDLGSLVDKTFCFRKCNQCRHFESRHKSK